MSFTFSEKRLREVLKGSDYESSTACIVKTFKALNVWTLSDLDNAPRVFGKSICGHSVWEFASYIRAELLKPPAPRKTKRLQAVETKEEKKEE